MAGDIPNLNVEVLVQLTNLTTAVNEAVAGMTKISNAAKESSEKASLSFTKLKDVMLGVFGGNLLTSGVMGLEKTLVDMNQAVQDAQVETNRLDTALKNSGNTSATVKTQVDATVKSYANLGFTHAQASQAMGTLVTATGSVTESTKLMSMAADLARYKHEDLNTAATTLARGTQGSVKAFKELGITLDTTLPKNEAIAKAFDELNGKIGGQAVAYTHTFAGEMAVLKERFNEAAVTIGNVLFPIITKLLEAFNDLFKVIKPFAPELLILAGVVLTAVTAVKAYEAVMRTVKAVQEAWTVATYLYGGVQLDAVVATDAQTASQKALAFVLNQNPWVKVVEVIALVVAALVELWNHNAKVRDIMITVGEFGIKAFGVIIQIVGDLVTAIMKLVTGPMKLMLEALSFIHAPGAKQALTDLNGAIKDTGTWFDKAATSVTNYSQNLEQLRKATSNYGMQTLDATSTADTGGIVGNVAGGNVDKAAAKAAKAQEKLLAQEKKYNDQLTSLRSKMDVALQDRQDKMDAAALTRDEALAAATKAQKERDASIQQSYNDKIAAAQATFDEAKANATSDNEQKILDIKTQYADKATQLQQTATDNQQKIIQQSMDVMTNAFANATKIDLGKLFIDNASSATGLVAGLKNQLDAATQLQKDAGLLAAQGYNQSFINEVIAQGPKQGDALAQSVLKAAPETQDSIKQLYAKVQDVSQNGLNDLAKQMNDGTSFATQQLAQQYAQISVDLQKTLADNSTALTDALNKQQTAYQKQLDAAQDAFDKANASARQVRDQELAKSAQTFADQNASIQQTYNDSIQKITQATMKQMMTLEAEMLKVLALMVALGAGGGSSPISTKMPTGSITSAPLTYTSSNGFKVPNATLQGPGITVNQTNNINGSTAPSDIANATANAAIYGQTLTLPQKMTNAVGGGF
jgi:hypothetical protein